MELDLDVQDLPSEPDADDIGSSLCGYGLWGEEYPQCHGVSMGRTKMRTGIGEHSLGQILID